LAAEPELHFSTWRKQWGRKPTVWQLRFAFPQQKSATITKFGLQIDDLDTQDLKLVSPGDSEGFIMGVPVFVPLPRLGLN